MQEDSEVPDDIVELNVSGRTDGLTLTKELLCSVPGSALEAMFSGRHTVKKVRGRIFISRDPELF